MDIPIDWTKIDDLVLEFSLDGQEKKGKVVKVYDGDSIWCVLMLFGKLYRFNCRTHQKYEKIT